MTNLTIDHKLLRNFPFYKSEKFKSYNMKRMHRIINHRIETIFIEIIILILNKMFEITIRNTDKNQNYMNKKLTVKLPKM